MRCINILWAALLLFGLANSCYAYLGVLECVFVDKGRVCYLTADYVLEKIHDGWVAEAQGHARGTDGSINLGDVDDYINMQGYMVDLSCCYGRGLVVGGDVFSKRSVNNIIVENGILRSEAGVFTLGGAFKDLATEYYSATGRLSEDEELYNECDQRAIRLGLINMVMVGDSGDVGAVDSKITNSKILLSRINVIGGGFLFDGNKYEMRRGKEVIEPLLYESNAGGLVNEIVTELPIMKFSEGWQNSVKPKAYNPNAALYLSCAPNSTISNNIFTAKTKTPGAYAIILKHSKNVRITNNTFEGFTVPVLMDKYSSIIDDSGNIIKPDITADSPESKLYGFDVDINKLIKTKTKTWWKFWQ
jgi:hypothetical protein